MDGGSIGALAGESSSVAPIRHKLSSTGSLFSVFLLPADTAIPRCHWQYWIRLEQNKEELIIPPFTEDEFTRILAVAQW